MKKRDIWISIGIISIAVLGFYVYSRQTGYMEVDAGGADATLRLRSGWSNSLLIESESDPVAVRARIYKPQRLSVSMGQDGNTWLLYSNGPWGKLSTIKVKNRQTMLVRLGPPFLIKPTVQRNPSSVSVGLSIIGQAGEQYGARLTKDGKDLPAPAVNIIDEAGKVLAAGKFAYG
jgi:hypothetical protein